VSAEFVSRVLSGCIEIGSLTNLQNLLVKVLNSCTGRESLRLIIATGKSKENALVTETGDIN
jgi:hypothetical protein